MKIKRIGSFLCLCLLFPVLNWAQSGYSIDIEIKGFMEDEAYLAYYFGEKQYIKDTTTVQNGKFTFEGEEKLDGGIYLVVLPPNNTYFEIIVDEDQYFSLISDTTNYVESMKVKGSEDNEVFYSDMVFLGDQRGKANTLQEELQSLPGDDPRKAEVQAELSKIDEAVKGHRASLQEKYPNSLYPKILRTMNDPIVPEPPRDASGKIIDSLFAFKYYRNHYFDEVDMKDDRLLRTPVMFNKVNTYMEKLTYKHPDSIKQSIDIILDLCQDNETVFQYFVVHFVNKFAKSKIMGMDAVYVHMVEEYYMKERCPWADSSTVAKMTERALAISPTLVGRIGPNFVAQDINGTYTSLHDVQADYTLLYFWDYGCGHCKKVTPQLAESFVQYQGYSVKIYCVSINGDVTTWKEKLKEYGLDKEGIINVQDHKRLSRFDQMYDITSTPRLFILAKDKTILAKQISVETMEEVLNFELGLEPPETKEKESNSEKNSDNKSVRSNR